jgi:cell division protein FtsI/penicillin-binding protein 2
MGLLDAATRSLPPVLGALTLAWAAPAPEPPPSPPRIDLDAVRLFETGATAPIAGGGTAELTLDPVLEHAAARLLGSARPLEGAAVAIEARTGRVLAWAGTRNGTPTASVPAATLAPAASLFKIVTTTALLEKHISPALSVCTEGGSSAISAEHLMKPKRGAALCGPFREALGRSRNAVFAQLATRFLRPSDLIGTAERLGFGRDAPVDVPAKIGTLAVPEGELDLARAAAGFVGSRLSPVGAAELAYTVASGGRVGRIRLIERADGYEAPRRREFLSRAMREGTARELARMMEVTVHSGTSREVFSNEEGKNYLGDVRVAGKTGTLRAGDDEATTSWFVGFAPSRAPRIVVSVLLENGDVYREKANEVGRDLLRTYFAARGFRGVTMPKVLASSN